MQEGFILLDGQNNILLVNNSARKIFNPYYSTSDRPKNILQFSRNKTLIQAIESVREKGHVSVDTGPDEVSGRQYRILVNNLQHGGIMQGVIVIILDITAEKQSEQIRREFAANVSHELKTPLTTITGFSEMISGG